MLRLSSVLVQHVVIHTVIRTCTCNYLNISNISFVFLVFMKVLIFVIKNIWLLLFFCVSGTGLMDSCDLPCGFWEGPGSSVRVASAPNYGAIPQPMSLFLHAALLFCCALTSSFPCSPACNLKCQPAFLSAFGAISRLSFIAFSFPFCSLSPECVASVCAYMHAYTHSCGGQRSASGSSGAIHLVSLTETWGSTIRLGWQVRKHQGFTSFCVLSIGVTGNHYHTWLFKLVVGIELRSLCLQGKYLTKWAISTLFRLCLSLASCPVSLILIICLWFHAYSPSQCWCYLNYLCCMKSIL